MFTQKEYMGEHFSDMDISEQKITNIQFRRCTFRNIKMHEITTVGCEFAECKFTSCAMNGAMHLRSSFLNCTFRFSSFFCTTFDQCKLLGSSLVEASTLGMIIKGGNWSYTDLRNIDFSRSDLSHIQFEGADLSSCNFEKSSLVGCNLTSTKLSNTNFKQADLREALIGGSNILSAIFKKTKIDLVQSAILSEALGAIVTY